MECRICHSTHLQKFLSLGEMPLSNEFLKKEQLGTEQKYPLNVYFCAKCSLVQLGYIVLKEELFSEYAYFTGANKPLIKHFKGLAQDVKMHFGINPKRHFGLEIGKKTLVVDIGSNDGTLLQCFQGLGAKVIGVEPAKNIAEIANQKGIETINSFLDEQTALSIIDKAGLANIVLATNVFAHVNHLGEFVCNIRKLLGVNHLLDNNNVLIVEVPYIRDLIEKTEFDTIYHEHLSYFSMKTLNCLFEDFNMTVIDAKRLSTHGGSLRLFVQMRERDRTDTIAELIEEEEELGLDRIETYIAFVQKIGEIRKNLTNLLNDLKLYGKRIIGYGAAAKGNILLNYCNIGTETLDYIVDTTPYKQGLYTPGKHIPIQNSTQFHENPLDYALLLAWNYEKEILEKEKESRKRGGKFIIPIPIPKVV